MQRFKSHFLHNILKVSDYFDNLPHVQRDQLKVMFHYGDAQTNEDIVFAEAYDQWAAVRQCDFIKNGRLQVALMPLNPDLSLDTANKKYLHSSQIEVLDLQFESYGFSGSIRFKIPYDLSKETLWSELLLATNLLAIQIQYQEDKLENGQYQVNKNTLWKIQGYIETDQAQGRQISDKIVYHYENKTENYLACRLSFVDAFRFISKQHFPVEMYTQQKYGSVFETIFGDWKALLSLKMDKGLTAFESIRPWICINCQYPDISFFDFFFRTLAHYQYQLKYDYTQLEPSYSLVDPSKKKITQKPVKVEAGIVTEIIWKPPAYGFANIKQSNHHWSDQNMADSTTINNPLFAKAPVRRDEVSYCPTSQQFKNVTTFLKSKAQYELYHQCFFWITLRYFSSETSILPGNQFLVPDVYRNKLGSTSDAFAVETAKIQFKNQIVSANYAGENSVFTEAPSSDDIQHIDYTLQHGIKIQTKVFLADKPQLVFPDFNDEVAVLEVYGWISDFNSSGKEQTYFLTAGNGQDPIDITTNATANNESYFPMHYRSESQLSYVVKLPEKVLFSSSNPSKTFVITLPYFVMQDHQVTPLRKDTPILIHLNQESGRIDHSIWHSLQDKIFSKDMQVNKFTFGANDAAGIVHTAQVKKLDEPSFEIFSKTGQNSIQITADKDAISIVYSNATEGK